MSWDPGTGAPRNTITSRSRGVLESLDSVSFHSLALWLSLQTTSSASPMPKSVCPQFEMDPRGCVPTPNAPSGWSSTIQSTKVRGWHCKVQPQLCWAPLPCMGDEVILRTGGLSQNSTPKWVYCRPDIRSSSTFCPPTLPHTPILALQDARRSLPTTQDIPFSFQ